MYERVCSVSAPTMILYIRLRELADGKKLALHAVNCDQFGRFGAYSL